MRELLSAVATALVVLCLAGCSADSQPFLWDTSTDVPPDAADAWDAYEAWDTAEMPEVLDVPEVSEPETGDGPRDTIGIVCANDEECQNGIFCDGRERCPYGFCMVPLPGDEVCNDDDDCTTDTCVEETASCTYDLMDDDGDTIPPESCGGEDCDDTNPGVHPGAVEVCGDGVDQDCDGSDGDSGTCGCPTTITSSGTYYGTTSGTGTYNPSTCAYSMSGPEWIYVITPSTTRSVTFATAGTSYDTVLYVRSSPCATGTEIACDDDGGSGVDSRLTVSLTGGSTYYLFMDGYSTSYYGPFTLTVSGL
jgi:hypothetical protein